MIRGSIAIGVGNLQGLSPLGVCERRLVNAATVALIVGEKATLCVFTMGALSSQVPSYGQVPVMLRFRTRDNWGWGRTKF